MAEKPDTPDAPLSAYERAAQEGVDPRCIPKALEGPPPVGDDIEVPDYPDTDHENWAFLYDRQMKLLPGRASQAYLDGVEILGMSNDRIPALSDLSRRLQQATGWQVGRIPGLLHPGDFFSLLSRRIFPSTDYIRQKDELDYTPAPDCFHDIFGHMPMLTVPAFADFYQEFGKAGLSADGEDAIALERLHWFTVEFGLITEAEGRRIFGAGILSSKEEVTHSLEGPVERVPYDTEAVTAQDYEVWHLQPKLFVLESFPQLEKSFRAWATEKGLL